jgi:glycosyltransferase Alg8
MRASVGNNKTFYFFIIYILALLIYTFLLPAYLFDPYQKKLIFIIALVGIWRYTWFFLNVSRAYIYKNHKFKLIRQQEEDSGKEIDPEHLFLLITTFRIGTDVTVKVYREAIKDAIRSGYDVTIIASIVEMSEERLVRKIFLNLNPPKNIKLVITRIKGTGKRDALAAGYRVVADTPIDLSKSVIAVIDGDSIITEGLLRKCSRLFGLDPELGGLTTDEDSQLPKKPESIHEHVYSQWYKMRFAQRNISMSSISLSDRVLTLTGRMSMMRASIVSERDFVNTVQLDHIKHWRLGTFGFFTGDDKSSLYYIMKSGWKMLYVPDTMVYTVEEIVDENFFKGSMSLMVRWFGNQYRTNARQLNITNAREVVRTYPWYAMIDQRLTRWTTPYGFFIALLGSFTWGAYVFFAYIWWVLLTRLLMIFLYKMSRDNIHPSWPFLLYYNQLVGSFVKIYIWNHLYKQSWTRQKTKAAPAERYLEWYYVVSSNGMLIVEMLLFLIIVALLVQLLHVDDIWLFFHSLKGLL